MSILIVDDEKFQLEIIKFLVQSRCHLCIIDIAENGKDAVKRVLNKEYDIIFMDLTMPFYDGYKTTRMIRSINKNKKTKIVALTAAEVTTELKTRCLKAGMNDFYTKPLRVEYVDKILNNIDQNKL